MSPKPLASQSALKAIFCESEVADYLPQADWDLAVLELAVNMVGIFPVEVFRQRAKKVVENAVRTGKPVVVISHFRHSRDLPGAAGAEENEAFVTALQEICRQLQCDNLYYLDGNLVYGFYTRGLYNPYTGVKLSYDGKEEKERKVPSYNDIEGHWCENIVKALVENGLTLEGERFMPDSAVNQRDFVKIVNYHNYFDDDEGEEIIYSDEEFEDDE